MTQQDKINQAVNRICNQATGKEEDWTNRPGTTVVVNRLLKDIRLEVFSKVMGWK